MWERLIQLLRRFWAWARRPRVTLVRRIIGVGLILVGIGWWVLSQWETDLQNCSTTTRGSVTKETCEPRSPEELAWIPAVGLLLLGFDVSIAGIGPLNRRKGPGHGPADDADDPPSPQERFRQRYAELNPWSRLASRLSSTGFRDQLAAAITSPGRVNLSALNPGDADLIKPLKLGPGFTTATATDWANAKRDELNRLRMLADADRTVDEGAEYDEGAAAVDELLDDLRDRRLLS